MERIWFTHKAVSAFLKGTTSDTKITREYEAISAHELNEICAFLLLAAFKVAILFLSTQISADQRLPEKTCQFLQSSMRAANPMIWNVDLATSGNFIVNVIFIIGVIITPNTME